MKYGDLAKIPDNVVPKPFLACSEGCDGEYSSDYGDYFLRYDDEDIVCRCGEPMILVQRICSLKEYNFEDAE